MRKLLASCLVFILCFALLPSVDASASSEPTIKVKLKNFLGNQTQMTLNPKGDFLTTDHQILLKNATEYKLKLESGQLKLYQGTSLIGQFDTLTIHPASENNVLSINQRPYSGSFQFIRETTTNNQSIRPINHIKLEEYLRGVVPYEMPALWHKEAVKAQAVAARTYAFSHVKNTIDDTIQYQVYGGAQGHPNSDAAIKETEGLVLKYNGQLISAVFSASNGGMTESNANAWNTTAVPYFQIRKDDFDPKTTWSLEINKQQMDLTGLKLSDYRQWWSTVREKDQTITSNLKVWMQNNGYRGKEIKITSIPKVAFSSPLSGGRVTKGSITVEFLVKDLVDGNGNLIPQKIEFKDVAASRVRAMLGIRVVQSYLVEKTENTETTIRIQGRGDGHGVGLSQWGAKGRAEAGQTAQQILAFYYPSASLLKEYSEIEMATIHGLLDVPVNHLFISEITYLVDNQIITGFPDGKFQPNSTVTRAQAATMIGRSLELDGELKQTPFKDVDSEFYASGYIANAVENGIITGYPDGTYRPNAPVTRGEMAILLARAFELEKEAPVNFSDVGAGSYYNPYIGKIIADGITDGYPDGTYKPNQALTRSQFSAFMARALDDQFKVSH